MGQIPETMTHPSLLAPIVQYVIWQYGGRVPSQKVGLQYFNCGTQCAHIVNIDFNLAEMCKSSPFRATNDRASLSFNLVHALKAYSPSHCSDSRSDVVCLSSSC